MKLKKEDKVAIIGSGPVGMCAMISARILGADEIIAIDIDETRLDIARKENLADYFLNPKNVNIEEEIKKITDNKGADSVIEAAGAKDTFNLAIKIARPNAIIGVVAMYEENQILPLPSMYGKNLTFKTGGVDAIHCRELVDLISKGKINTNFLITHKYSLSDIKEAYKTFESKKDNCIKIAIVN